VVRLRFHAATCRACPVRPACPQATEAPRQRTVRPHAFHAAIQAARPRQETAAFTVEYARRVGLEGTQSPAIRRGGRRWARYRGLAKTHLQQFITAVALHVARLGEWWLGMALANTRCSPVAALRVAAA
jgi:transposase